MKSAQSWARKAEAVVRRTTFVLKRRFSSFRSGRGGFPQLEGETVIYAIIGINIGVFGL